MIIKKGVVGLLAGVLALPAAAGVQTADTLVSRPNVSEELDVLVAARQYERAERWVRERVDGGADPAAEYFRIGKAYFDHRQWQRSAAFLQRSLTLRPASDDAHQLLGLDWRELHRPDKAEAELLEAARENPASRVDAYFAGHQLLLNGKFEAALPYLYQAIEWKPLQPQALQALAFAQARLGNYGLAESYYRKAVASTSRPDAYPALINLSILLLLGHEPAQLEEGMRCAEDAKKIRPDSADANYLGGKALFKLGRLREAEPELVRAAKLNPKDGKPHFLLAQIFDQMGQPDRARKERETLARIQSGTGEAGIASAGPLPMSPD
jgi:tetratricopeptide (TPR) repeat protein